MNRDHFGFNIWQGRVTHMPEPHQHGEIEFNFVSNGSLTYLFGGRELQVLEGQWLFFWATWPHHLISFRPGTTCTWLTLPLASFLRFGLPQTLTQIILHNQPMLESNTSDAALFQRWHEDGPNLNPERQRILELELEARLRRLALGLKAPRKVRPQARRSAPNGKAEQIAQLISEHYLEAMNLTEIANRVGLHPNYATSVFKQTFAMTITAYLNQHRIAHVQRLLVTSDRPVLEIAFASGFGSSSQFYVAFERALGCTPLKYRRAVGDAQG
jgi:AraC family transcriptional regulator, melibiose operon regulatory protein